MNIKSNFTISNIKYLVENKTISNNEKEEQRKWVEQKKNRIKTI